MAKPGQKITAKQEKACMVFIETGCKSTAYRGAYNVAKMKPATINRRAFELFETDMVMARVEELQKAAQERHETTVDNITTKLRDSYQVAKEDKNSNAMTAAAMGEAKLHGLLIDRSKVETSNYSDMTPEQLTEQQREIENDFIRQGGRDYLVQELAKWQDILVLWDAGQFERYAAGEAKPITH